MASILRAGTAGRSKTHIMHKCNLSYRQLQAYLDLLREKDLLKIELRKEKNEQARNFVTTDKGRVFLKAYSNLRITIEEGSLKFRLWKSKPESTLQLMKANSQNKD